MRLRFGFVALGLVAIACGGETFTIAASDAGGSSAQDGASPTDDGGGDASGSSCVTLPNDTGGEQQFCADEQHIFAACGNCEPCRQADLNDCKKLGETLSDAMKQAIHACRDRQPEICGDYTTYGNSPCVRHALVAAQPTSAQRDAKDRYCQACPNNPNECAHFFDLGGDAGTGSTAGIGAYVLVSSDSIASEIASNCSGGTSCTPVGYALCSGGKLCAAAPADNCKTGFCFK